MEGERLFRIWGDRESKRERGLKVGKYDRSSGGDEEDKRKGKRVYVSGLGSWWVSGAWKGWG